MIEVMTLNGLTIEHLRLANSFVSHEVYSIQRVETETEFGVTLHRRQLSEPYKKRWPVSEQLLADYNRVLEQGLSFGAFDGGSLVGLAIAEREDWNSSLMVREFRVAPSHRRRGIGRHLMDRVASHASRQGFRTVVCETQNTNVPAIDFYRSIGFEFEGVDLSFYTNDDALDGEVAVFMKLKLA